MFLWWSMVLIQNTDTCMVCLPSSAGIFPTSEKGETGESCGRGGWGRKKKGEMATPPFPSVTILLSPFMVCLFSFPSRPKELSVQASCDTYWFNYEEHQKSQTKMILSPEFHFDLQHNMQTEKYFRYRKHWCISHTFLFKIFVSNRGCCLSVRTSGILVSSTTSPDEIPGY